MIRQKYYTTIPQRESEKLWIYRDAERRGKYRALWNDHEGGKGGEAALVFTKSFW